MWQVLNVVQVISSILLIFLILIQTKGTGFGRVWGGSSSFTRRGIEKTVFKLTFVVTGVFITASIATLLV